MLGRIQIQADDVFELLNEAPNASPTLCSTSPRRSSGRFLPLGVDADCLVGVGANVRLRTGKMNGWRSLVSACRRSRRATRNPPPSSAAQ
jgi:hypothetical protein